MIRMFLLFRRPPFHMTILIHVVKNLTLTILYMLVSGRVHEEGQFVIEEQISCIKTIENSDHISGFQIHIHRASAN